jgi:predicted metal-dependent hydrolase
MFKSMQRLLEPPTIEQCRIELAGKAVDYTLKRSGKRRRSIGLSIDERGLTVSMPLRGSEKWLHSVLQQKAQWIVDKLAEWEARKPATPLWVDGQFIKFMGEPLTLRVVPSLFDAPPLLRGRQLFVHVTDAAGQQVVEQAVARWYQREAELLFRQRVAYYAPLLNVTPSVVALSAARTQWGSCTARGTVRLNWHLIKLPLRLIDYVVVHELAHLVEMNHSPAFWQVVARACPDYQRRRNELRRRETVTG